MIATIVALGMGIIDWKLLFYNGISEGIVDKKISTREYNNREIYNCFNHLFPDDFGRPALNVPPVIVDDIPHPTKRACCTPDILLSDISFASENSVITLTTPSDSPPSLVLTYDDLNHRHAMKKV